MRIKWTVRGALVLVVALLIAATALAYFTSNGRGAGTVSAGSIQPVTLSAGVPSTALYPGAAADVAFKVSNPNPVSVHLGSVSLNGSQGVNGLAVDSSHGGCALSALSWAGTQTNGGAGWTVPPRSGATNGSLTVDLAGALSMSTAAANVCQGARFTVYLTAGS